MLDWIAQGMKADYMEITNRIGIVLRGNIANSIHNFEQLQK